MPATIGPCQSLACVLCAILFHTRKADSASNNENYYIVEQQLQNTNMLIAYCWKM